MPPDPGLAAKSRRASAQIREWDSDGCVMPHVTVHPGAAPAIRAAPFGSSRSRSAPAVRHQVPYSSRVKPAGKSWPCTLLDGNRSHDVGSRIASHWKGAPTSSASSIDDGVVTRPRAPRKRRSSSGRSRPSMKSWAVCGPSRALRWRLDARARTSSGEVPPINASAVARGSGVEGPPTVTLMSRDSGGVAAHQRRQRRNHRFNRATSRHGTSAARRRVARVYP